MVFRGPDIFRWCSEDQIYLNGVQRTRYISMVFKGPDIFRWCSENQIYLDGVQNNEFHALTVIYIFFYHMPPEVTSHNEITNLISLMLPKLQGARAELSYRTEIPILRL